MPGNYNDNDNDNDNANDNDNVIDNYLDDCVEEDEGDDQPEHELGLADVAHSPTVFPIPPDDIYVVAIQYIFLHSTRTCKKVNSSHFSNLLILFCKKVSGAPERSASASIVVSCPAAPCTLFTATHNSTL